MLSPAMTSMTCSSTTSALAGPARLMAASMACSCRSDRSTGNRIRLNMALPSRRSRGVVVDRRGVDSRAGAAYAGAGRGGTAMTEAEWLDGALVWAMIEHLRGMRRTSPRKLRLLCCAFCRRAWDEMPDGWYRRAVQISEWHADGRASPAELKEAEQVAQAARAEAARMDFDH